MLGNCAHCHNPRGFPTVTYPQLAPVLNFLPSATGGIFQFPLEVTSPRITRGLGGAHQIAYITPSLMDLSESPNWFGAQPGPSVTVAAYAPWRSLIYRNVDTPFTYTIDYGLYPHMPMNTPGYDCRVKRVMSDWMVSIPAVRKNPQIPEYGIGQSASGGGLSFRSTTAPSRMSRSPPTIPGTRKPSAPPKPGSRCSTRASTPSSRRHPSTRATPTARTRATSSTPR